MKHIDADKLLNKIEELKKEHIEFAQKRGYSSLGNAARIRAGEDDEIRSIVTSLLKDKPQVVDVSKIEQEELGDLDAELNTIR